MKPLPPRPRPTGLRRASAAPPIYLPGGVPVLRAAVEDLLRGSWKEPFRTRARDIAATFERCFRSCNQPDLAILAHSITLLLEMSPVERGILGEDLPQKLDELLRGLEEVLVPDEERMTG